MGSLAEKVGRGAEGVLSIGEAGSAPIFGGRKGGVSMVNRVNFDPNHQI
jgi:hypothetical protein